MKQVAMFNTLDGRMSNQPRFISPAKLALARMWTAARCEAGIAGLRWHDLRYEALSSMASKGLHVGEL